MKVAVSHLRTGQKFLLPEYGITTPVTVYSVDRWTRSDPRKTRVEVQQSMPHSARRDTMGIDADLAGTVWINSRNVIADNDLLVEAVEATDPVGSVTTESQGSYGRFDWPPSTTWPSNATTWLSSPTSTTSLPQYAEQVVFYPTFD